VANIAGNETLIACILVLLAMLLAKAGLGCVDLTTFAVYVGYNVCAHVLLYSCTWSKVTRAKALMGVLFVLGSQYHWCVRRAQQNLC